MSKECQCRWCLQYKKFKAFKEKYNFSDDDKKFIDDLYDELNYANADLEYKECILAGRWPSAVEQLTAALKQAKTIRSGTKVERK